VRQRFQLAATERPGLTGGDGRTWSPPGTFSPNSSASPAASRFQPLDCNEPLPSHHDSQDSSQSTIYANPLGELQSGSKTYLGASGLQNPSGQPHFDRELRLDRRTVESCPCTPRGFVTHKLAVARRRLPSSYGRREYPPTPPQVQIPSILLVPRGITGKRCQQREEGEAKVFGAGIIPRTSSIQSCDNHTQYDNRWQSPALSGRKFRTL